MHLGTKRDWTRILWWRAPPCGLSCEFSQEHSRDAQAWGQGLRLDKHTQPPHLRAQAHPRPAPQAPLLSGIKASGSVTTLDQGSGVPSPSLCPRGIPLPQVAPRLRPSPCTAPTTPAPPQACYDSKPPPTREFPSFPPHSDHPVGGGHRGDFRCGPGSLAWLRI